MRKTKAVDNLINYIADQLATGKQPSLESAVELECLRWTYLELESRANIASELGLRNRAPRKLESPVECDPKCIHKLVIHLVCGAEIDDASLTHSVAMLRAYTRKEITASALFGERCRKPRNNIPWQAKGFMGDLAHKVKQKYKHIPLTNNDAYVEYKYNLFYLLSQLSSNVDADKLAEDYDVSVADLKSIKDTIQKEMEFAGKFAFRSDSMWRNSYADYLKKIK